MTRRSPASTVLRAWLWAAGVLIALLAPAAASGHTPINSPETASRLQAKILTASSANRLICRGELVCGIAELPRFYTLRGHQPAWMTAGGPAAAAGELIRAIEDAGAEGLRPSDYHIESLNRLVSGMNARAASGAPIEADEAVDLDFLLTDAFLLLGSHLLAGRVNPETLHPEWGVAVAPGVDLAERLQRGLESGRIREALDGLKQPHPGYAALKETLRRYRQIEGRGGWASLPEKASWSPGQTGEIAERLRVRLESSGDLSPDAPGSDPTSAGPVLAEALKHFQARHGLDPTGRLDPPTLGALNVPVQGRIRQIELNLERWRWIPHELGARHILVNVPDFNLDVVEDGHPVMRMRVVVGRHYRRTPVMSAMMAYLVFNPDWNIPTRIAVEDILPKIRKDPGYIGREKIRVFESWTSGAAELDPSEVDWSGVTAQNFRFKLRKDPGPKNDLGRIKFMFPNKHSVYLHDTTSRQLFERGMRGFSSGCIRIEKPLELAEYLLRGAPGWSREAVSAAIASGERRSVNLPQKIPVHLIYLTAWSAGEGRLELRPDLYQRDPVLDKALSQIPPRP